MAASATAFRGFPAYSATPSHVARPVGRTTLTNLHRRSTADDEPPDQGNDRQGKGGDAMDTSRNDLLGEIARDAELERSDFLVQATEQLNKFLKSNR